MKKLYWQFEDRTYIESQRLSRSDMDISDYLIPCTPQSSPWYMNLRKYIEPDMTSWTEFYSKIKRQVFEGKIRREDAEHMCTHVPKTMKSCPGLLSLFKSSYIVRSPCEIHITASIPDKEVIATTPVPNMIDIKMHDPAQLRSNPNLFQGKFNLKFDMPVLLGTKEKIPYVFLNPSYHAKNVWDVVPGVIDSRYAGGMGLITNTLVDSTHPDVHIDKEGIFNMVIKKHQPIAYLWYPEPTKLVQGKVSTPYRQKF